MKKLQLPNIILTSLLFTILSNGLNTNLPLAEKTCTQFNSPIKKYLKPGIANHFKGGWEGVDLVYKTEQPDNIFDSSILNMFFEKHPTFLPFKKDVVDFYSNRKFETFWISNNHLKKIGLDLIQKIEHIENEGLTNKLSYTEELKSLVIIQRSKIEYNLEILLSCQYLQYANYVWLSKQNEYYRISKWFIPIKKIKNKDLLNQLTNVVDVFSNPPIFGNYNKLQQYLVFYNQLKQNGGFVKINAIGKNVYKLGDSSIQIAYIRKLLFQVQDLSNDNHSTIFDQDLFNGVLSFQKRMGLIPTGKISNLEIAELNKPIETRISQIKVNMERMRWLPLIDKVEHIEINIPEYKLHLYNQKGLLWSMKIVIGKTHQPTAVFSGEIQEIILCPYWNIPPGILNKEILPALRRNKNYLINNDMEWNNGKIRQKPGNNNALGLIKFLFPNRFNIYMHDTPNKYLFNQNTRSFSHGCIRLEDALKMAVYLLKNYPEWDSLKLTQTMKTGKEKRIGLNPKIPIFIVYKTAWVDENGKLNFRNDIYHKDNDLNKSLSKKTPIVAK